ncbi:uncharacterized protein LOC143927449 isoform X1 [Lithobates pipiens]
MSSSACIMISNEGCSEGTPGPNYDARSTVCLLDADGTDELHNLPLDADQPPAPEELHCVVENIPKRKSCHQCSGVKPHLIIFTLGLICLFILCGLPLFLYMLYQDVHYSNLLQTLTERLDAQSQILKQMVANQIIAGYNPGGL